jgi:phosphonate transport system substrate-binding protein
LLGEYDAGAVKEAVYAQYKDKGLRILAQSPPVSEHLFVASKSLDQTTLKRLRDAMYGLSRTPQGLEIIKKIKATATGLVPVRDSDYDSLRKLLAQP